MKKTAQVVAAIIAAALLGAGCAPPPRVEMTPRASPFYDTGTPAPGHFEREVRYYRDENGVAWDDRGKRHDAPAKDTL